MSVTLQFIDGHWFLSYIIIRFLKGTDMKKTLILTIILLVLMVAPQYAFADSYTFNDGSVNIDLSGKITAYTRGSDVSKIPGAPDNFELLVHSEDFNYNWYFYYLNGDSVLDFSVLDDERIMELVEQDSSDLETDDVTAEVYSNGDKYLVVDSYDEKSDQYIHFYATGVGRTIYYFVAPSVGAPLNDAQKADFRSVIDGLEFVRQAPPTREEMRQASMKRILKRFGLAFGALAIFVVLKLGFDKIKGSTGGKK